RVGACPAAQDIVAGLAGKTVVAGAALQRVRGAAAAQDIVAAAAAQDIGSPQSVHGIVSAEAVDRRSVAAAGQHVVTGRACDLIVPRIPDRMVYVELAELALGAADIDDSAVGKLRAIMIPRRIRLNDELVTYGIAVLVEPSADDARGRAEPGHHEGAIGEGDDLR